MAIIGPYGLDSYGGSGADSVVNEASGDNDSPNLPLIAGAGVVGYLALRRFL